MAVCERCNGDSIYGNRLMGTKPIGKKVDLFWLCDGCYPDPLPPRKPHGLNFYKRITYQIVIPVIAFVFGLVMLGVHL